MGEYLSNISPTKSSISNMMMKVPPAGQLSNMILHHPGTFDSCLEVCPTFALFNSFAALEMFICQVASPTLKGKHCLLTSFVKGAGIQQGRDL